MFWGDLRFTSGADRDATQTGTQSGSGVAYADSGGCAGRRNHGDQARQAVGNPAIREEPAQKR
uniref:Uncharacterized protein n=1 Tax=Siphoviridae sp. ct4Am4 TaxID=2826287 RepID=A0A8S5R279_9CAUD|nr:MAG TPA: hypothetical protein [Siphoviridae sp. ct4Am4]